MKKTILLAAIISLSSCYNHAKEKSFDGDFEIEFLFEKDGIKVYRFNDCGYHYFTTRGETMTTMTEQHGKTTTYHEENIGNNN